jgi:ABC-type dipeptide/oligopeptide/nickel transport system ATPase subunit
MDKEWLTREARRVAGMRMELKLARMSVAEEKAELGLAQTEQDHSIQAQSILGQLARTVQQKVHERISSVVSTCLAAVFEDPYEFKIHFEQKRGSTVAQLVFSRNGQELSPLEASGGGAVDVAAFALRAACLVLHRPRLRRVLFLDEPFKFVSKEFQPAIKSMLEQLSKDLKIQVIMVTHNEAYETGKVINL